MTVGGMGFIPERLLMMMMMKVVMWLGETGFRRSILPASLTHALVASFF